ncbi:MAG: SAM-dependent methyltransferase [Kutzneria sp.]|nr:SAM-dependent methyltransferase [Kutzneria sp.]
MVTGDPDDWPIGMDWAPVDVDMRRASAARMYDYYLGGCCHFAVDRAKAKEVLAVLPQARVFARENRAFLRRAVRYCLSQGVRQFLDLGAGLPTMGATHQIADHAVPGCRVVYVDSDPVAICYGRLILEGNPNVACVLADITRPEQVLAHPDTLRLLDVTAPVAVIMCAVLHFVPDDTNPKRLIATYRDAVPAGSYLVLSHATPASDYSAGLGQALQVYQRTQTPGHLRTREQINALVGVFGEPVPPGVVHPPAWHPEQPSDVADHSASLAYAAIARHADRQTQNGIR